MRHNIFVLVPRLPDAHQTAIFQLRGRAPFFNFLILKFWNPPLYNMTASPLFFTAIYI